MPAYVIVELEVTDPEGFAEYRPPAQASVANHGGRFIVRDGEMQVVEGEWMSRLVVLEFENLDAAREWYDSEDYQACLGQRLATSKGRMVFVEGVPAQG